MISNTATLYLDHAATSAIAPEVHTFFVSLLSQGIGNSSSAHSDGSHALALLNNARENVAQKLGCDPTEITFTSGGTEGNNWILQRVLEDAARSDRFKSSRPHLITSSIEHSSVVSVAQWMKKTGQIDWSELAVEPDGRVSVQALERMITPSTVLVSIGHGNNEIGTLQDLKGLGDLCRSRGVLFHADACQTFCHEPFVARDLPVDFMVLSGHKIRAPKGVGAVYVRKGLELTPLLFGGKQERGLRPGTTSVELICAFAKAASLWTVKDIERTHAVRNYSIQKLKSAVPGVRFNGPESGPVLCHVLSFTTPAIHSKALHRELANAKVSCSTGAACGTGLSDSSAVLLGLGRSPDEAHQIRISFSPTTEMATIDTFIDRLTKILKAL